MILRVIPIKFETLKPPNVCAQTAIFFNKRVSKKCGNYSLCLQRVYAQTGFYQENLASAFSYAQSLISLVFCCSLGFLVPWFSPLQLNKIWRIFCVMYGEESGWTLIVCLQKLYLTDMLECLLCYIQF